VPKLPEPPAPAVLAARAPAAIHALAAGSLLFRVYFRAGRHPTLWNRFRFFGPTGARFDHHLPGPDGIPCLQDRGILYAAMHGPTCIAEAFQADRVIDRERGTPWLAGFETVRALALLDLTGTWTTRAGASTAIASGQRARARRWSVAIHEAFPAVDGLLYPSSMHGHAPALALYERARDVLPALPSFHRALNDPALDLVLRNVAFELGYKIY
jgi:hypothetical protein